VQNAEAPLKLVTLFHTWQLMGLKKRIRIFRLPVRRSFSAVQSSVRIQRRRRPFIFLATFYISEAKGIFLTELKVANTCHFGQVKMSFMWAAISTPALGCRNTLKPSYVLSS